MSPNCKECKEYCDQHGRLEERTENLKTEVENLKSAMSRQQGYIEGKFDRVYTDMKDLSDKLTNRIETGLKEIKDIMNSKDTKEDSRFNTFLGNGILPALIMIITLVIEHYLK